MNEHERTLEAANELLTEQQLADQWHTTPRHIRRLRIESGLPYIKLGRLIRFDQRDVGDWLEAHKRAIAAS